MTFTGPTDPALPPAVSFLTRWRRQLWIEAFNAAIKAAPNDVGAAYKAAWGQVRAKAKEKRAGGVPAVSAAEQAQERETMPWKIVEEDGEFCVYKEDAEGQPSEKLKCYPDRAAALAYQRALYANVEEKGAGGDVLAKVKEMIAATEVKAWDESKHPRDPKGQSTGGQFTSAGGGGEAGQMEPDEPVGPKKTRKGTHRGRAFTTEQESDGSWTARLDNGEKLTGYDYRATANAAAIDRINELTNQPGTTREGDELDSGDDDGSTREPGTGWRKPAKGDHATYVLEQAAKRNVHLNMDAKDVPVSGSTVTMHTSATMVRPYYLRNSLREIVASAKNETDLALFAKDMFWDVEDRAGPRAKPGDRENNAWTPAPTPTRRLPRAGSKSCAIVEEGGEFCVYEDDEKLECFPDRTAAEAFKKARDAGEDDEDDEDDEEKSLVSFKAYRQPDGRTRWILVSSGGFEDRDGEVVSTAFLESAVNVADRTKERGPLLIFHVPGSNIGTCDYQAVVGEPGFLLESGLFDDSEAGRRAASYYTQHAKETGASIKFLYANRTPDGIYQPPGAILERSLMKRERAAFPWSALALPEVNDMAKMSQEKRDELETVLGSDLAVQIIDQIDSSAQALKEAGVRSKEQDAGETTDQAADPSAPPETEGGVTAKETLTEAAQAGGEFELVLTPEALDAVAEKAAGAVSAQITALASQLQAALDGLNGLRTAVEKNAQDLIALQRTDEAKIADKVAHLPRATVRQIQAPELYRATQSKAATEPDPAEKAGSADYLGRLKKIVHEYPTPFPPSLTGRSTS